MCATEFLPTRELVVITERAVAIRALGWRLRALVRLRQSPCASVWVGHALDVLGQSPLPETPLMFRTEKREQGTKPVVPQRAVAIRALGWRLRALVRLRQSPCASVWVDHAPDVLGQSPPPKDGHAQFAACSTFIILHTLFILVVT